MLSRTTAARLALGLIGSVAVGLVFPRPASAQAAMSTAAGLDRFYKPLHWVPLQVTLTNQGAPARVEVRARFATGTDRVEEYRLPERELRPGANQLHTLYLKAPHSYSAQPLVVDLYRDGRLITTDRPALNMVPEGDWLVMGLGAQDAGLKVLEDPRVVAAFSSRGGRRWTRPGRSGIGTFRSGQPPRIHVTLQEPAKTPDRWQGLEAADMVVLSGASERDFTPEQLTALKDYVSTGGMLVITGGVNWQRLTTPFFRDLLPVDVIGSWTTESLGGIRYSGGAMALCDARPKSGANVRSADGMKPLVVDGRKGSGKVAFVAFDTRAPSFASWRGAPNFWTNLMLARGQDSILPSIAAADTYDPRFGGGTSGARLSNAPYAVSQLDIPAFYVVALFLLAYIVVLVPVNYYFLKVRDRKEYAWLTTPAIVAMFSVGAYMIGYGFKGGNTMLVKVGLIEAHSGQDAAPSVVYAGLFSPRKTSYEVQPAAADPRSQVESAATLLSEPYIDGPRAGMRIDQDDTQRVREFAVDMWAMRVLKAEGLVRLGKGIDARLRLSGGAVRGEVRNNSPYSLEDCRVLTDQGQVVPIEDLPAGGRIRVGAPLAGALSGQLADGLKGSKDDVRLRRAVLGPVSAAAPGGRLKNMLVGWVKEPMGQLSVNGRTAREHSATLMLVHLDQRQ